MRTHIRHSWIWRSEKNTGESLCPSTLLRWSLVFAAQCIGGCIGTVASCPFFHLFPSQSRNDGIADAHHCIQVMWVLGIKSGSSDLDSGRFFFFICRVVFLASNFFLFFSLSFFLSFCHYLFEICLLSYLLCDVPGGERTTLEDVFRLCGLMLSGW